MSTSARAASHNPHNKPCAFNGGSHRAKATHLASKSGHEGDREDQVDGVEDALGMRPNLCDCKRV